MHQVMVRYKVKPERVAENERLVRAVEARCDEPPVVTQIETIGSFSADR
jgi:hypothetical protein